MNQYHKQGSFSSKFGENAAKKGFTQIPNVLVQNLRVFNLAPVDYAIVSYLWSRGTKTYTAVSFIASATGKHPNTVRESLRKLERMGYLRKLKTLGDANKFDLGGLEKKIRGYTDFGISPTQFLDKGHTNKGTNNSQKLVTNKELKKEEIERLRRIAFPDKNRGKL